MTRVILAVFAELRRWLGRRLACFEDFDVRLHLLVSRLTLFDQLLQVLVSFSVCLLHNLLLCALNHRRLVWTPHYLRKMLHCDACSQFALVGLQ